MILPSNLMYKGSSVPAPYASAWSVFGRIEPISAKRPAGGLLDGAYLTNRL